MRNDEFKNRPLGGIRLDGARVVFLFLLCFRSWATLCVCQIDLRLTSESVNDFSRSPGSVLCVCACKFCCRSICSRRTQSCPILCHVISLAKRVKQPRESRENCVLFYLCREAKREKKKKKSREVCAGLPQVFSGPAHTHTHTTRSVTLEYLFIIRPWGRYFFLPV